MNYLTAVRAYIGAEGLWAKAQKDALHSLEHYAITHDDNDYKAYLHFISVPLGDSKSRIEMQKNHPNRDIARQGFLEGGNNANDIDYMIDLFLRFQHFSFMSEPIEHWTKADQFLAELNDHADKLHAKISAGSYRPDNFRTLLAKLDVLNQHLTEQENLFSTTLATASHWVNDYLRNLGLAITVLFTLLCTGISWLIIGRIRDTETALHKNEADLRIAATAFDLHQSLMITDAKCRILRVNQAFINETGYSMEEVIGQTPRLLKSGCHDQSFYRQMWLTIHSTNKWEGEIWNRDKSGAIKAKWLTISAVRRGDGVITHYVASHLDINQRKQDEMLLRQYKTAIDTTHEGFWITDKSGYLLESNKAYAQMSGYTVEELLGMHIEQLEAKERSLHEIKIHIDKILSQQWDVFETRHRHKDGHEFDVEVSASYVPDSQHFVAFIHDITQRKAAEKSMRIAAIAFETHEAILITDANANIIRVNQAFQDISGYSAEDVLGKNPSMLSSGRQDQQFYAQMWQQLLEQGTWTGEIWDKRKNGQIYPKWLTITAVRDQEGVNTEYVAIFNDITERKKAEEEIYNLAYYDALTQLPNRRLLIDRIRQAQMISLRNQQFGALLFLDMDRFKILNDTMGHDHGDLFLIEIAGRLQHCIREIDTVARIGGDEFVILIEELGLKAEDASHKAALIAEKIRTTLSIPYQLSGHEYHSSPSVGVSLFHGNTEPLESILKQADMAMYQAKESGRNMVRFFDPAMQIAVATHATLEADLRNAISGQQLRLYYQIQLDSELRPLGAEGLVRWVHPVRGLVMPKQFIHIAEKSSLILQLGHWVLEAACKQLALWQQSELTQNLILAINVSAQQFKRHDFVESVMAQLHLHQVNPDKLKLELTESVVLNDVNDVIGKMHDLQAQGVRLSLDDFGTGYSSLSYLKQLPLDQLKIDQSFVRDIITDPNDAVMVQTIINLAQNFRLSVIAEGVENEAQLEFLRINGCTAYQGYLFSKPLPLDEFEELLKQSHLRRVQ